MLSGSRWRSAMTESSAVTGSPSWRTLAELPTYARFAAGLPRFLRSTWTPESAATALRERLERRGENFLATLDAAFSSGSAGIYPRLFAAARVDRREIPALVARDGVEPTLERLRDAGVFVTFEEFKGRTPIVRDGVELAPLASRFDNPRRRAHFLTQTGGSTGAPTRVGGDLDHLAAQAANLLLAYRAHGVLGAPTAVWHEPFPDGTGVNAVLRLMSLGQPPRRWLSLLRAEGFRAEARSRLANRLLFVVARAAGRPLPRLAPLALEQAGELARWTAESVAREGRALVATHVSKCLRVALAARALGIDLTGVTFSGGGEPPTVAKVRTIVASGARWMPGYWLREAGIVGLGCAAPHGTNDLHLQLDSLALVSRPRALAGSAIEVPALLFTSLLPTAPKLLLNVESDDFATLERRACGCPLGALGLGLHVRDVRSFRKLTGEGVTLLGGEMERLLDELLPAACGGSANDYQLVEQENERGLTELVVVVDPSVELTDERRVIDTVERALAAGGGGMPLAGVLLGAAHAITVRRARPRLSAAGKHLPILVGAAAPPPAESVPLAGGAR